MPEPDDLFGAPEPVAAPPKPDTNRLLADRRSLAGVGRQDSLVRPGGALTRIPPIIGKTTVARSPAARIPLF